jgi:hypothetical protein
LTPCRKNTQSTGPCYCLFAIGSFSGAAPWPEKSALNKFSNGLQFSHSSATTQYNASSRTEIKDCGLYTELAKWGFLARGQSTKAKGTDVGELALFGQVPVLVTFKGPRGHRIPYPTGEMPEEKPDTEVVWSAVLRRPLGSCLHSIAPGGRSHSSIKEIVTVYMIFIYII